MQGHQRSGHQDRTRTPGSVDVNPFRQKKKINQSAGEYVDYEEIDKA
jgi:hypothetical protein